MDTLLDAGGLAAAAEMSLDHEAVPLAQLVSGAPRTGSKALAALNGAEIGVWEMTPGAMSDVEVDEVFVVLQGVAEVEFVDSGRRLTVGPGDVVRLSAGQRTVWTVTECLRKVYIS